MKYFRGGFFISPGSRHSHHSNRDAGKITWEDAKEMWPLAVIVVLAVAAFVGMFVWAVNR